MTRPAKKPAARQRGTGKRYFVKISAEQYVALQKLGMEQERGVPWMLERALAGPLRVDPVLSIRDGVSTVEPHRADCADCIAERAGI